MAAGLVVVLFAAAMAAAPLAASAQTSNDQQSAVFAPDQDLVDEVRAKADNHRNPAAAQRLNKIADGMEGAAGGYTAAECRNTAARYGVAKAWASWCDEIERRENWTPPDTTQQDLEPQQDQQAQQQDQQQQQEEVIDEFAVQNQNNNQPGIKLTKNGNDITTLNVPTSPLTASYEVSLTTRPTGNVTLMFIDDNFTTEWRNILIDATGNHKGTARPNVGKYIDGIHRARCNASGKDYIDAVSEVFQHNLINPDHLHLQNPDITHFVWVCETIMTFTPQNWNVPQRMHIFQKPRNQRVMTSECTGIVDGRYPQRCNLDAIQHVAFSYDGGYPHVTKTLNLNLAG